MNQEARESKVDLTPMLDVVFIMLIFFVVTATFVLEKGIDVNQSSDDRPPPPNPADKAISVRITSNNQFFVNGEAVDIRLLRPQFERLNAENPEAPVIINPHADSSTQALVKVMDSASEVGIKDVKFAQHSSKSS